MTPHVDVPAVKVFTHCASGEGSRLDSALLPEASLFPFRRLSGSPDPLPLSERHACWTGFREAKRHHAETGVSNPCKIGIAQRIWKEAKTKENGVVTPFWVGTGGGRIFSINLICLGLTETNYSEIYFHA